MSDAIYSVIIVAKDYSKATIARIAALFKKPAEQIEIALTKGDIAAKKNLDLATAELLKSTIEEKTGAECTIDPLADNFEDFTEVVKPAATKAHPRNTDAHSVNSQRKKKSLLLSPAILIGLIGLLSIAASAGYFYYRTTTPAYSIEQIRRAVNERDLNLFQKHVDYEGIISRGVHAAASQASTQPSSSSSGWGKSATPTEDSSTESIGKLSSQVEASVEHGDKFPPSTEHSLNAVATSLHTVQSNGEAPKAQAIIRFPEFGDKAFTLIFELRKQDNFWRIVELENLLDLLNWQTEQESALLDNTNQQIIQQLDNSIGAVDFTSQTIPPTPFVGPELRLTMSFKNASSKIIKSVYFAVEVSQAESGKVLATQYFSWGNGTKQLAPNESTEVTKDITSVANPDLATALSKAKPNLKINYEISSINFADGSELIPFRSYRELVRYSSRH